MIRAQISRTSTLAPSREPKPAKGPRTRKCSAKGCMHRVVPDPLDARVTWCSDECSVTVALAAGAARKAKIERASRAAKKVERADDQKRKVAMMNRNDWLAEVQTAFNAFIRERDRDQPCICCGKFFEVRSMSIGGQWDAGHYLGRGAAPHLCFVESNVHKQIKGHNRPGGTTRAAFRAGMIARIGLAGVEALECDQESRDYTIDDLKALKAHYVAKLKQLKEKN